MTGEMFWLGMTVLLSLVIWIPYTVLYLGITPLPRGTVITPPTDKLPEWAQRCSRAHVNLLESLVPFATLILMLKVTGKADASTATAAMIFFFARVAHVIVYAAGIPYLRPLMFSIGAFTNLYLLWQVMT